MYYIAVRKSFTNPNVSEYSKLCNEALSVVSKCIGEEINGVTYGNLIYASCMYDISWSTVFPCFLAWILDFRSVFGLSRYNQVMPMYNLLIVNFGKDSVDIRFKVYVCGCGCFSYLGEHIVKKDSIHVIPGIAIPPSTSTSASPLVFALIGECDNEGSGYLFVDLVPSIEDRMLIYESNGKRLMFVTSNTCGQASPIYEYYTISNVPKPTDNGRYYLNQLITWSSKMYVNTVITYLSNICNNYITYPIACLAKDAIYIENLSKIDVRLRIYAACSKLYEAYIEPGKTCRIPAEEPNVDAVEWFAKEIVNSDKYFNTAMKLYVTPFVIGIEPTVQNLKLKIEAV